MAREGEPPFLLREGEAVGLGLLGEGLEQGLRLPLVAGLHQVLRVEKALLPEKAGGELGEEGLHPFHQGPALPLGEEEGEGLLPQGKVDELFLGEGPALEEGEEPGALAEAARPHQVAVPPVEEGGLEGPERPLLPEEKGAGRGRVGGVNQRTEATRMGNTIPVPPWGLRVDWP